MSAALFDGLDDAARAELRTQLRRRDLAGGDLLCRAGDSSDCLYVVESGLLQVLDGESGEVLGRQRVGDVVGEVALLTRDPRSATLVAQMPSVVSELARDDFLTAATHHPKLLVNLATIVSRRLVSRTAPSSARVTALVVRPGGWEGEGAATAAARESSAAPLTVLDGTGPLPELLAALDAAVGTPVLVRVPSDAEHLTQVLALCDRALAVAGPRVRELPAGAERVDPGVEPARLGRRLAHASVGIAFGAGGAKGWAHVGVLRSLERAGYVVDAVAGSSVGAWVGAWTALGHDAAAVEGLLRERFDDYAVHAIFRQGGPQGTAVMTRAARETTQDARFADLAVPLTVLAADLAGKQPAVLDVGPVAQALVTAMTVPGLYPPVRRGAQRLVDAVVLTPVPTSALTGVDVTIAVNLFGSVTSPAWPGATAGHDAGQSDRDPVVESLELASHAAAAAQTAEADVQVTPDLGRGNWRDFGLAEQYLAAGEEAMEAALPTLRALARPSR